MSKDIHAKRQSRQSVGQGQRVMETQRVCGFPACGHFLNSYFSQGTNPPLIHRLIAACRSPQRCLGRQQPRVRGRPEPPPLRRRRPSRKKKKKKKKKKRRTRVCEGPGRWRSR